MFNRLKARIRFLMNHGNELNRRVEIENILGQIATGKRPLPDREQCRVLALKLGTPKEYWPDEWK